MRSKDERRADFERREVERKAKLAADLAGLAARRQEIDADSVARKLAAKDAAKPGNRWWNMAGGGG